MLFIQVASGQRLGLLGGIVQQGVGQGFQAGLAGNLGAGAALGLVGQVKVFQACLGVGCLDGLFQFRGELVLLGDALEDGVASLFHLSQVAQAFFQIPQLGVVQAAGDFFPVTGNKGDGGTFVEQGDGSVDLPLLTGEFFSNDLFNTTHGLFLDGLAGHAGAGTLLKQNDRNHRE